MLDAIFQVGLSFFSLKSTYLLYVFAFLTCMLVLSFISYIFKRL